MLKALVAAGVLALSGLLGAAAFNPDNGFLLQSEPLWRVFGIASYAAWLALPVIGLIALLRVTVQLGKGA